MPKNLMCLKDLFILGQIELTSICAKFYQANMSARYENLAAQKLLCLQYLLCIAVFTANSDRQCWACLALLSI